MCFFRVKNILSLFIIPIFWNILNEIVFASLDSDNDVNNFKKLLNFSNLNNNEQLVNENPKYKNFAEGGLITTYSSNASAINNTSFSLKKKITPKMSVESNTNKSDSDSNSLINKKSSTLTKLDNGGANLFLGAPEVIHINGTSSIKPRKGVYYNKIVPRKGVDSKYDSIQNNSKKCFLLSKNECYVTPLNIQDLESYCCNKTNAENIRKQMPKINCSSCILTNVLDNKICENVCLRNKTNINKIKDTKTQFEVENELNNNYNKNYTFQKSTFNKTSVVDKLLEDSSAFFNKKLSNSSLKQSKPKITKVPDDVEFVDDLFKKSKKDALMPILISIFLLPLIGMLIFFIWKRIKDYWNKRYYKRMDFLIDGMYNDQYS